MIRWPALRSLLIQVFPSLLINYASWFHEKKNAEIQRNKYQVCKKKKSLEENVWSVNVFFSFPLICLSVAVEGAYDAWFKAGKAGVTVEVVSSKYGSGTLKEGYVYAYFKCHYFDKDDVNIENSK